MEATTETLETPPGSSATTRLESQPTNPNYQSTLRPSLTTDNLGKLRQNRYALIGGLCILAVVLIAVLVSASLRNSGSALTNRSLVYPGAETVMDMTRDNESVLQLRTDDPLDQVVKWYVSNLKPTKNAKLSETSVLLKTDEIIVGIASENNKTNILIKQPVVR